VLQVAKYQPQMSNNGIDSVFQTTVLDEFGESPDIAMTGERPLTIYLDKFEVVTLMTMGSHPELLTLGYLRNQGLVNDLNDIIAINVDWDVEAVAVSTKQSNQDLPEKMSRRTVTSGCGQGTMFGNVMDKLDSLNLSCPKFTADFIYTILSVLNDYNLTYKQAGAVHGCALVSNNNVDIFIEDVGRHNAVDAISGWMWLEGVTGDNKVFYTTGRLTSEMVIKVAQMEIPLLLSRSGVTEMGLRIAHKIGIGIVARAKGKHFLVFNALEQFISSKNEIR
jgi:FdhD protein